MPNYDYECPQCAHRFELWQAVGAEPPSCEKCGAPTKKVFQVPRIIFKGSGFYVTDKRSESTAAKKESASEKSASESKSDAPASGENAAAKSEAVVAKTESAASQNAS